VTDTVQIGQRDMAIFEATNNAARPITGTATFNVQPEQAGKYFNKVQCFCFTEQRLEPGQTVDMAVSFYVDPGFVDDEDTKDLSELTLSYTFYPVEKPQRTEGQAAAGTAGGG
jgi:cytochrome c oxidase assembly protein subunit 11